jgi:threonine dehydratase
VPAISEVYAAAQRIKPYVFETPIVTSTLLNQMLGHEIYFKAECLQRTGAFKARGACNAIARLVQTGQAPKKIVANSSGNHAQAVAWAASLFSIPATIYIPKTASAVKIQATKSYGAEVILCDTRQQADKWVEEASQETGCLWLPPYNHPDVISGQGTATFEALQQIRKPIDAVAAPCGGGGLISGTYIAAKASNPHIQVIGAEPALGNDASLSRQTGRIHRLDDSPNTLADGARTLAVGELTFPFIKNVDFFHEVTEEKIIYWTQWLQHLLKLHVEPTSAMTMDAVVNWIATLPANDTDKKRILVIVSGGNIDQGMMQKLWQSDCLSTLP